MRAGCRGPALQPGRGCRRPRRSPLVGDALSPDHRKSIAHKWAPTVCALGAVALALNRAGDAGDRNCPSEAALVGAHLWAMLFLQTTIRASPTSGPQSARACVASP